MKKIILIAGGVILVAILGRFGWAYYQLKLDETKVDNTPELVTATAPEPVQAEIPPVATSSVLQSQAKVVTGVQILDCKGDLTCFLKAMDNKCAPAKLTYSIFTDTSMLSGDRIDLKIGNKTLYETRGNSGVACNVHQKLLETLLTYDTAKLSQQDTSTRSMFQGLIDDVHKQAALPKTNQLCEGTSAELKQYIYDITNIVIRDKYPYLESCKEVGV